MLRVSWLRISSRTCSQLATPSLEQVSSFSSSVIVRDHDREQAHTFPSSSLSVQGTYPSLSRPECTSRPCSHFQTNIYDVHTLATIVIIVGRLPREPVRELRGQVLLHRRPRRREVRRIRRGCQGRRRSPAHCFPVPRTFGPLLEAVGTID